MRQGLEIPGERKRTFHCILDNQQSVSHHNVFNKTVYCSVPCTSLNRTLAVSDLPTYRLISTVTGDLPANNLNKHHVFAPMGRFQLELIYLVLL